MIMEIGTMIINDVYYADHDWHALSLVGNLSDGQREITGYQYFSDGTYKAQIPKKFSDITYQLKLLRDATKSNNGEE
jgi:hypothetical protein